MGKSPGKWIKTLLFGKKASRTHSSKARDASKTGNDKNYLGGKGSTALTVSSPVISEPVLVSSNGRGSIAEMGKGVASNVANDETVQPPVHPDEHKLEHPVSDFSNGFERVKKEQAAVKAQAAFRGYLARRAFRALKGIIRLQALVRGHLVRRQGVATLRAILAIVKLQAVARGWKIRHFGVGFEVNAKSCNAEAVEVKPVGTWHEKVLTNVFVRKLLASAPRVMPLHIQHNQGEPNSTLIWLERWTYCRIWKSVSQSKKTADPKPHAKRSNYAMETESGRQKRIPRKNPTASVDSGAANIVSEPDKPKRNLRKVSGSMVDSLQEHPQSELEKVKRNLRKVSNLTAEASIRPDMETEKPICSLRKVSSSPPEALGQAVEDSTEKTKKDDPPDPETKPDVEVTQETVTEEGPGYVDMDTCPTVEVNQLQSHDKEENMTTNEVISSKDEQTYTETLRTSKRRSSFSSKSEYAENGSPNTPTLPSYMATTESAKAKLRAQNSPRFGSDSGDKSGFTRRHSLPSSTNGKMSSQSPRTQRLIQASGKGGLRNDRSLTTSRDGTDRHIQVEWRR